MRPVHHNLMRRFGVEPKSHGVVSIPRSFYCLRGARWIRTTPFREPALQAALPGTHWLSDSKREQPVREGFSRDGRVHIAPTRP